MGATRRTLVQLVGCKCILYVRQAVVKHLAVLNAAVLVSCSRSGREMRYTLRPRQLDATARWMAGLAAEWDRRLEVIKRLAEADDEPGLNKQPL